MGRAHGHNPAVASAAVNHRGGGSRHRARRRFNVGVAIQSFNAAAAERAHLSQLTEELATEATLHAYARRRTQLREFAREADVGVDLADLTTEERVRDGSQFNLHTELRVALDEGRRLDEREVDRLASDAVTNATCGVLAEEAARADSTLSVSSYYAALRDALHADTPAAVRGRTGVERMFVELT